jgi:hypothetical protein
MGTRGVEEPWRGCELCSKNKSRYCTTSRAHAFELIYFGMQLTLVVFGVSRLSQCIHNSRT